jgi:hypothetical protein
MSNLSTILASTQKGFLKNVLEGAGLTLLSSGAMLVFLNQAIDLFTSSLGQIPNTLVQLMGLSGFDIFFSLILGAMLTRYTQQSTKTFFGKQ